MENISGIYRIICKTNGDYYYGSAKSISKRWYYHCYRLRCGKHENIRVQRTWNKYGSVSFQVELIEIVPIERLLEIEDVYLKEHVGKPHCMNVVKTAKGAAFTSHSIENRNRMSELKKAYYSAHPEYRKKVSQSNKESVRKKNSESQKILWSNPEYKERMVAAMQSGRPKKIIVIPMTPEERHERMSSSMKTRWQDPEYREKMSSILKTHWQDPEYREKVRLSKPKTYKKRIVQNLGLS